MYAPTYPPADCQPTDWRSFIGAAVMWLGDVGDGNVAFDDICKHIGNLSGFPGWETWGAHDGRPGQKARHDIRLEADKMVEDGALASPTPGVYRYPE